MNYSLTFLTSNVCNSYCKYCYQDRKNKEIMTYEQIVYAIKKFSSETLKWNKEVKFFGGEPMLLNNLIKEVVTQCSDINYTIITNGYFLNYEDYIKYMIGLENVSFVFSLEANPLSQRMFRNPNDNYGKMINRIIELSKTYNVSINMSINKIMFENIKETEQNIKRLIDNGIYISFYSIKGEDGFINSSEFKKYILETKTKSPYVLNKILSKYRESTDSQFLCTFDSSIFINSYLNCLSCSWDKFIYGNLMKDDIQSIEEKFKERIAVNHISLHNCSTCNVPVGVCQISCLPFILSTINKRGLKIMDDFCEKQRILFELSGGDTQNV